MSKELKYVIVFLCLVIGIMITFSLITKHSLTSYIKKKEKEIEFLKWQINEVKKENALLKLKEKIIQNEVKDEILQKKIEEQYDSVSDAINFFLGESTAADSL